MYVCYLQTSRGNNITVIIIVWSTNYSGRIFNYPLSLSRNTANTRGTYIYEYYDNKLSITSNTLAEQQRWQRDVNLISILHRIEIKVVIIFFRLICKFKFSPESIYLFFF